ncbi:MAG: hypothetical protein ACR2QV_12900, partial [Gammaproteobacteria bacterium]
DTAVDINFGGANAVSVPVQLGDGTVAQHTAAVTGAQWGTVADVEISPAGTEITFTYTPNGFAATDALTVQLTDLNGDVGSGTATLTISGAAVTVPPQDSLPGKTSSLSPLSLGALLAGIPLLRRLRRKR